MVFLVPFLTGSIRQLQSFNPIEWGYGISSIEYVHFLEEPKGKIVSIPSSGDMVFLDCGFMFWASNTNGPCFNPIEWGYGISRKF